MYVHLPFPEIWRRYCSSLIDPSTAVEPGMRIKSKLLMSGIRSSKTCNYARIPNNLPWLESRKR